LLGHYQFCCSYLFIFRAFFSIKLGRLKLGIEAPYAPERLQDSVISCGRLPLNNSFGGEKNISLGYLVYSFLAYFALV